MSHEEFLRKAIETSQRSVKEGCFPVGAVLVKDSKILATGMSKGKKLNDPTYHAETAAIRDACTELQTRNLQGAVMYTSLEPCLMCFAACSWASIQKIVYAVRKTQVSKKHFEGTHNLVHIKKENYKHIQLVHIPELEDEALKIIDEWEKRTTYPARQAA